MNLNPRESMSEPVNPLVHATPDCAGRFREVKSRVRMGGKQRTVRHYTCTLCKAQVAEAAPGAQRAYWEQERFAGQMEVAQRDAKAEGRAARAFSAALRAALPGLSADDADTAADACIDSLRREFLKIGEDHDAFRAWRDRWGKAVHPARDEMVRRIADALPEFHATRHVAPNAYELRTPRVAVQVDEENGRVHLVYRAPAGAPADTLTMLEIELAAALPPVPGIEVVPEVVRA